jgi:hypothetical protein
MTDRRTDFVKRIAAALAVVCVKAGRVDQLGSYFGGL